MPEEQGVGRESEAHPANYPGGKMPEPEERKNNVVPFRLTKRLRRKRQEAEARWLYRTTGGFVAPEPPSPEAIEMFLEGWELP
jgi:hypothetical protein